MKINGKLSINEETEEFIFDLNAPIEIEGNKLETLGFQVIDIFAGDKRKKAIARVLNGEKVDYTIEIPKQVIKQIALMSNEESKEMQVPDIMYS